jgi:hypothetical protein
VQPAVCVLSIEEVMMSFTPLNGSPRQNGLRLGGSVYGQTVSLYLVSLFKGVDVVDGKEETQESGASRGSNNFN